MVSKTLQLLSLLPRNPAEFCERIVATIGARVPRSSGISYRVTPKEKAIAQLSNILHADLSERLREPELTEIEAAVTRAQSTMLVEAPFSALHNGGSLLACLSYAMARVLRPKIVIESGVCYGVTSAHLLQALHVNGHGHLHSIDLPPLGKNGDSYVGGLVPTGLRNRWTLHRGTTRRILEPLLESLLQVDLFLHDSLHTYHNMHMEFATVWPKLRSRGVLLSDDVEGNAAFHELMQHQDIAVALVLSETGKDACFGIAVKQ